jgi:hypothetical protein
VYRDAWELLVQAAVDKENQKNFVHPPVGFGEAQS